MSMTHRLVELASRIDVEHHRFEKLKAVFNSDVSGDDLERLKRVIVHAGTIRLSQVNELLELASNSPSHISTVLCKDGEESSIRLRMNVSDDVSTAEITTTSATEAQTFTKADLRGKTGLGNSAITKYTKSAGVETPPKGAKTHRYTSEETRKILIAIRDGTQDASVERRCKEALSELA